MHLQLTNFQLSDRICSPSRAAFSDIHRIRSFSPLKRRYRYSCTWRYEILRTTVGLLLLFLLAECLWTFKVAFAACLPTVCNPEKVGSQAARSALATYAAELCSSDLGVVTTLASQAAELFLFTRQCQPGKRKKEQGPQHTRVGVPSVEGLTTRNGIESNWNA